MVPLILDWLHELIMPHPERDDRTRLTLRLGVILVTSVGGIALFG